MMIFEDVLVYRTCPLIDKVEYKDLREKIAREDRDLAK